MQAVIHWAINGTTGHGSPVEAAEAAIWVRVLNYKHGSGTHWLETCIDWHDYDKSNKEIR